MPLSLEIIAKLLAPLITAIIGAVTKHYLEARPKLITYLGHASAMPLLPQQPNQQPQQVNSHSIVVRNIGKKTAHNLRVGHNLLPLSYQVFPRVSYQVVKGQNNAAEIVIPTLVPDEQVSISYLYFPPILYTDIISYTKSDECMAKTISAIPSPQPIKIVVYLLWSLVFIGASTLMYWLIFFIIGWIK